MTAKILVCPSSTEMSDQPVITEMCVFGVQNLRRFICLYNEKLSVKSYKLYRFTETTWEGADIGRKYEY